MPMLAPQHEGRHSQQYRPRGAQDPEVPCNPHKNETEDETATHASHTVGRVHTRDPIGTRQRGEPKRGVKPGRYTQDDARRVVAYAAERHITVVPEIDMPGHSAPALIASRAADAALAKLAEVSIEKHVEKVAAIYEELLKSG